MDLVPIDSQPWCKAFERFEHSIDKWWSRFLPQSDDDTAAALYQRYELLFRQIWPQFDKESIVKMLKTNKSVRRSLIQEPAEDCKDRVVRLYAMYEGFLQDLGEELHGEEKEPFGKWLFERLPQDAKNPKQKGGFSKDPLSAILPDLELTSPEQVKTKPVNEHVKKKLATLKLKHNGKFSITNFKFQREGKDESLELEWTDWHCFLYGLRNVESHSKVKHTLRGKGILNQERREKIRKFLTAIIQSQHDEGDLAASDQKFWASNMIRLLTDMEYQLWKEERGEPKDEPKDPVGVRDDNRQLVKHNWSEFLKMKKKNTSTTMFEECLSYSVKLWVPRLLRQLASSLVKALTTLPDLS